MNDGKLYEELIYRYLLSNSYDFSENDCEPRVLYNIENNVKIEDSRSGRKRQIDLLMTPQNQPKLFIIECKDWNTPIDSPIVESFIQKCDNLYANQCIMFSSSGFTHTALNLGKNSRGLHLITKSLSDLMYLLEPIYEYSRLCYSCPQCSNTVGFFGPIHGSIHFDEVMHIISDDGRYFKAYWGTCDNCFIRYVFTSKTNTITPAYKLADGNQNHYIPIDEFIISNDGTNKVVYQLASTGEIQSIVFGEIPCNIISQYLY